MAGDDVKAGILAVHGWLRPTHTGHPYLRIVRGRCPNLEDEFKRYVKKRVDGKVIDQPNQRRHSHGMDCLRYAALFDPHWIKPRTPKKPVTGALRALRQKRERHSQKKGPSAINLGQGGQRINHG